MDEQISYGDLARRCGIDERDLRQIMRMAIVNHIFHEPRKGVVAHSALSKCLVQIPHLSTWLGHTCTDSLTSKARVADAMQKWPGSQEPQHTAFALADPNGDSYYQALERNPAKAQRFADGMKFMEASPALAVQHLFHDLQWSTETYMPFRMVDLGGSQGHIAIQLLRQFPSLKCEVQDLPETVALAKVPEDLEGRLTLQAHDILEVQPLKHADVYFFRSTLHNWSDKYVIKILRNLIPALKHGSKVILNESCMPEPNLIPRYHAQVIM